MPHYIRLLKPPSLQQASTSFAKNRSSSRSTSASIAVQLTLTCTTDLGDAYYAHGIPLLVTILPSPWSSEPIAQGQLEWKPHSRVVSEVVSLSRIPGRQASISPPGSLWVHISAQQEVLEPLKSPSQARNAQSDFLLPDSMPEIISVFAPVMGHGQTPLHLQGIELDRRVLRRLVLPSLTSAANQLELCILEEMGESIARHIWDAALASLALYSTSVVVPDAKDSAQSVRALLAPYLDRPAAHSKSTRQILELGTGCGLVGLGLALLVPNAELVLTDLPEAMDILEANIALAKQQGYASGTSVESCVLDWDWALQKDTALDPVARSLLNGLHPDLVVVSDCTYNSSSFEALIATLRRVVMQGRSDSIHQRLVEKADVIVSLKTRHESEAAFFEEMDKAGFRILAKEIVVLPDRTREEIGLDLEKAEIYAFALQVVGG